MEATTNPSFVSGGTIQDIALKDNIVTRVAASKLRIWTWPIRTGNRDEWPKRVVIDDTGIKPTERRKKRPLRSPGSSWPSGGRDRQCWKRGVSEHAEIDGFSGD